MRPSISRTSGRAYLKKLLFRFLWKVGKADDSREIAANALRGLIGPQSLVGSLSNISTPAFMNLGTTQVSARTSRRQDPIFITARFRSGSTLLWNIFRNVEGCTAYFEPLHHRRPFALSLSGNREVSSSHKNVDDYWREYVGLDMLGTYFRDEWNYRHFFMSENFWDPNLKRYIEIMIERAPGRPVLQFNRIDFRLPWFRQNFPFVKLIHLYRHPREQWCSALRDIRAFSKDDNVTDFRRHDRFFLGDWVADLKFHFPFLDWERVSHPYEMFYYVWKLSYLFGTKYSHYSFAFEQLVDEPRGQLQKLFAAVEIDAFDSDRLERLIVKPRGGTWKDYADDAWFREQEERCETTLDEALAACR